MKEIYLFKEVLPKKIIDDFLEAVKNLNWFYGIPGGFLYNIPNRKVNALGDGSSLSFDKNGKIKRKNNGSKITFWTARMNQNNISLGTQTQKLNIEFENLIFYLRKLLIKIYPNAKITDNTFNIAVCNYYIEPENYIAPHTDDNIWYPREVNNRPIFASITLYPFGVKKYAKFEVYENKQWKQIDLPDQSIFIMFSDIIHRVKPIDKKYFSPRINITFRSTFSFDENPLLNILAVSNHARYYRPPSLLFYPKNAKINEIIEIYNKSNKNNNFQKLILTEIEHDRSKKKKELQKKYEALGFPKIKYGANMVVETFALLCLKLGCC